MVLDCHIHIVNDVDSKDVFCKKLNNAGVEGGIVFSYQPASFDNLLSTEQSAKKRISQVMEFTKNNEKLFPFFFIDPMEEDSAEQIDMAVDLGIAGFKVICCHHYPQNDKAMKVYEHISKKNKPILFHSGILYNSAPSAQFNRPGNFEDLIFIDKLRFALAHISWPWCDELVSVFGKWNYFSVECENGVTSKMFIDVTPGTPPIYREEALTKLITVGYPTMPDQMIFGSDRSSCYNSPHIKKMIERDCEIYDKLEVSKELQGKIFHDNVLRFIKG